MTYAREHRTFRSTAVLTLRNYAGMAPSTAPVSHLSQLPGAGWHTATRDDRGP